MRTIFIILFSCYSLSANTDTVVCIPLIQFQQADKIIRKYDLSLEFQKAQQLEIDYLGSSLKSALKVIENQNLQIRSMQDVINLDTKIIQGHKRELTKVKIKAAVGGGTTAIIILGVLILIVAK